MFGNRSADKDGQELAKKLAKDEAQREVRKWSADAREAGQRVQRFKHSPERKDQFEKAVRDEVNAINNLEHWMRKA